MKSYTPGPWVWHGDSNYQWLGPVGCDSSDRVIDDGSAHGEYSACIDVDGPDAALIAAAPELLEALQSMLSKAYKQNWNDNYPEEVEAAQAAIAKALGK